MKLLEFNNVLNIVILIGIIIVITLIIKNYIKVNQIASINCECNNKNNINESIKEHIDPESINQNISNSIPEGKTQLVLYYTEWCGYSKQFLPEWKKIKEEITNSNLNNIITLMEYDCDKTKNICMDNNINGYPTLIFHKANGQKVNYPDNMQRNAQSVISFVKSNL